MDSKIKEFKLRRQNRILNRRNLDYDPDQPRAPKGESNGGQFVSENKTETLSREDKQRDKDYRDAIKKGDMETAQRLIDEAAQKAGYTLSAYHGTGDSFTVFRLGRQGIHLGSEKQASQVAKDRYEKNTQFTDYKWCDIKDKIDKMPEETRRELVESIYYARPDLTSDDIFFPDESDKRFSGDIKNANDIIDYFNDSFGETEESERKSFKLKTFDRPVGEYNMRLYAKINTPFSIDCDILAWTPRNISQVLLDRSKGKKTIFSQKKLKNVKLSASPIKLSKQDRAVLEDIVKNGDIGEKDWNQIRRVLSRNGYDGIKYLNEYEGDVGSSDNYSYIALSPNDVKSADTIVRDEDGDIIPLSQRFTTSSNDIRGHGNISNSKQIEGHTERNRGHF